MTNGNELPPPGVPARQYSKAERHAVNRLLLDRHATGSMCRELKAERARQDVRWGEQNHPDMTGQPSLEWFTAQAERSRDRAEHHARTGTLAWDHILQEEWDEAREQAAYGNTHNLRTELVQVMAVAAAWVEAIDRREVAAQAQRRRFEEDEAHPRQVIDNPRFLVERESFDATTMHDVANGQPRTIAGMGMTEQTRNALADMGYVVEEFGDGPMYDAIVVSKPERGKAQAYAKPSVFSDGHDPRCQWVNKDHAAPCSDSFDSATAGTVTGRLPMTPERRAKADAINQAYGAAGQPVSSYSGGGVRDVTEGKPRIDLMWPLGVPFDAQVLTRVGLWLERGMRKYAERNWERFHTADALTHALASLNRHLGLYMSGDESEDHAAAIITNVIFAETIRWKIANNWTPEGTFGA